LANVYDDTEAVNVTHGPKCVCWRKRRRQ